MGHIFRYALESGILLCLGYIVYKWVMAGECQHTFNRAVLYIIYFLSFLLPLVPSTLFGSNSTLGEEGRITARLIPAGMVQEETVWQEWLPIVLVGLYILGVLLAFGLTLTALYRIVSIIRGGKRIATGEYMLVMTDREDIAPFSFYRYYVMSRKDFENAGKVISIHETRHLQLCHWVDLLFVQLTCVFQWFNPASWLLGEEFKALHEYQADQAVIASGIDISQYQLLLIKKAVGTRFQALANSLNHSKLKKRVTMMYKSKSSAIRRFGALLLLPALGLGALLIQTPVVASTLATGCDISFIGEMVGEVSENSALGQSLTPSASTSAVDADTKVYDTPEKIAEYPGGLPELMMFLVNNLQYPTDAVNEDVQGRVVVSFVIGKDGMARDFKIVKGVDPRLDAEALRVLKLMGKWTPAQNGGKSVASIYSMPVLFKLPPKAKTTETKASEKK